MQLESSQADMFTGIIAALGNIVEIDRRPQGLRLRIDAGELDLGDLAVGDSVAVNGVCLTAIAIQGNHFDADVSQETLACTIGLDRRGEVNLEKALRLADRLGGHLVSGHVDGVGEVRLFEAVGDSWHLVVRAPQALAKYIARKGSIAIQGVSLTVNDVDGADFDINLIPHTLSMTTLRNLRVGSSVNLEVDQIARYVERMRDAEA